MNMHGHLQQAWVNLMASKLRSFLAVLGILVGTAAVVALISCGQLATEKALEQFKSLGTDLLAVSAFNSGGAQRNAAQVSAEQWHQLGQRIPWVVELAPYSTAFQTLSFRGQVVQGVVIGADESLKSIIGIELAEGQFVSFVDSFEHYCVIGDTIAQQIQNITQDNPVGQQLRVGNALYTIIGRAAAWHENGFFNEDINRAVIIPLAGMPLVHKDARINNVVIRLKPDSPIDEVIDRIKDGVASYAPQLSVFPRSARQIIASMESQGQIFTLLLGVIGGISLLVGGIGVMNVMLVSVSERKKEIGIRKAVGAKNRDIQALFLVESVMLSLVGGMVGVLLGLVFTRIVAYFSGWSFVIYLLPPAAGFLVSAATGVFFGFYPAYRASKLEPMDSLRSE